jgi:hypothetical protein
MFRPIAVVMALALCSLSASSSAYAGGQRSVAKIAAKKLFSLPPFMGGAYACAWHYLNVKGCRDQGDQGGRSQGYR